MIVTDTKLVIFGSGSMQHIFAPSKQLVNVPEDKNTFEAMGDKATAIMQSQYGLSKLILQQFEKELASRVAKGGNNEVMVKRVNPGWCATGLSRYYDSGRVMGTIFGMIGRRGTFIHAMNVGKETHGSVGVNVWSRRRGILSAVRGETKHVFVVAHRRDLPGNYGVFRNFDTYNAALPDQLKPGALDQKTFRISQAFAATAAAKTFSKPWSEVLKFTE